MLPPMAGVLLLTQLNHPTHSSAAPRLRPTAAPHVLPRLAGAADGHLARQCPGLLGTPRLGPARPAAPELDDPDIEDINSAYESHVQFYTMAKAFSMLVAVFMLLISMFAECGRPRASARAAAAVLTLSLIHI